MAPLYFQKNNYRDEWKSQSNDWKLLPVETYFYVI